MARTLSVDELKKRRAQLDARIADIQAKEKNKNRKKENRRKVLAGAAVLYHAENDPVFKSNVMKMIDGFLKRPDERAAFDLAPLPDNLGAERQESGNSNAS